MFTDLIEYPIESSRLRWEARQVVRDLHQVPHLLLRLKLAGTYFPQRALEPWVRIGRLRSRFVQIAPDGLSASAYFDRLPRGGTVELGYGPDVLLRFPERFGAEPLRALEVKRLPPNVRLLAEESASEAS
jgi:hypothetical protein